MILIRIDRDQRSPAKNIVCLGQPKEVTHGDRRFIQVTALPGVRDVVVELTFDPPWTPQSISAEGRALLGG